MTNLKVVSNMKLHRDLAITQMIAWHLAIRIREAWNYWTFFLFDGSTEVDETYIGGKDKNSHEYKKLNTGHGTVGETAVVATKDRSTNEIQALVVTNTKTETLTGFVHSSSRKGSHLFTDDASAYESLESYKHQDVEHFAKQYVDGMAHANGMESFVLLLKRGFHGSYHHMSSW